MRQLGDFAAWLGLILIVLGVVYYTPKLVEYVSDDSASRPRVSVAARPPGALSAKRNMAMHHTRFDRSTRSD
ncbi:MAG: hypothetical protein P4L85_26080 [Paludisphaera borealis]|uniref:hypothetical protein n=1 Tax=Paludisphaera borealis TaxID=1387353 RepID=UPI002850EB37|nr:hypothetical protein [Paludisphaera borealis]MDR3622849.1 hypothetical protein [Paludisphaera borealis]